MNPVRLGLVLLAIALPQEGRVGELLSRLDDDSIQVRTEAARELVRLGKAALPEVRKALETSSGERRERLAEIVRRIGDLDRLSALLKPPARVTVSAKDRPLREVLEEIEKQSGAALGFEEVPEDARITLDLRAAGLWDALDAACRASGKVMYEPGLEGIEIRPGPYSARPRRVSGSLAVFLSRIEILSMGNFAQGDRSDQMVLHVAVAWEKGTQPSSVAVRLEGLADDAGTDLMPGEDEAETEVQVAVSAGDLLAASPIHTPRLPDPKAKKLSRVRIEVDCSFVLRYGGVTFKEPGEGAARTLECPQFAATLLSSGRDGDEFTARIRVQSRADSLPAEADFVLRLADGTTPPPRIRELSSDGASNTYTVGWPVPEKGVLKELMVRTPVEMHVERIPFALTDVPLE